MEPGSGAGYAALVFVVGLLFESVGVATGWAYGYYPPVNSDLNSRAAGEWTPIDTVQSTAGHSKVSVTTNIYGHAMARSQEQAAQMIEEIMTPLTNELK